MALRFDDKKALVAEVATVAQSAQSVVAAEYRGLPVAKLTELRAKARANRVYMRVVKNTLARRAIAGTQFECVGDKLKGPLILAFSQDDPGAAARLIKAFAKDNDKLVPTLVSLGGTVLPGSDLERVASLPTKDQALAQLLGVHQGPDRQVRSHAGRASREARAHDRSGQGPEERGRLRRSHTLIYGYSGNSFYRSYAQWLLLRKTSSTRSPT